MSTIFMSSIEIWNLKYFEHVKFELGQAVVIAGENGTGKSSLRMVIEQFFLPGGDPCLIRRGCDEGKAIITFTNGYRAEKTIRRDGLDLHIFNPEGGEVKPPVKWLTDVLPRNSFDPIPFLDRKDATERAEFLLKYLPVSFSVEDVNKVLSQGFGKLPAPQVVALLPSGSDIDLARLQEVQEEKRSARTMIGQKRDDFVSVIRSLESSQPKDDKDASGANIDWSARREEARSEMSGIDVQIAKAESQVELESEQLRADIIATSASAVEEQRRIIAAAESEIKRLRAKEIGSLRAIDDGILKLKTVATEFLRAQRDKLNVDLATLSEKAKRQTESEGVRQAIAKQEVEYKTYATRYEHYTQIIAGLERLMAEGLKALKIPGFEVRFEKGKRAKTESAQIFINGLPLDEINRAQAITVAIQLIRTAQKASNAEIKLPLLLFESSELTDTTRAELKCAVEGAGMQLIVTVPVPEQPLTVRSM